MSLSFSSTATYVGTMIIGGGHPPNVPRQYYCAVSLSLLYKYQYKRKMSESVKLCLGDYLCKI